MPEPDDDMESEQPRWFGPSDDELPAFFPVSETVASTEHTAIALTMVAVYRDGLEFRLERRLRRRGLTRDEWGELTAVFMEHHPWGGPRGSADRLRYGLVLGDGEQVLADRWGFGGPGAEGDQPNGHMLQRREGGGGGGGRSFTGSDALWLWPLPPAGPIELVLQWPSLGIGEERILLDGTALIALADRARSFWT